jgi:hypothetical protein
MSESRDGIGDMFAKIGRRWPVVVVAILVGAALGAAYSFAAAADAGYESLLEVRVITPPSIQNAPTPGRLSGAVLASSVIEPTAEENGIPAEELADRVTSAINPRQVDSVLIRVRAQTETEALTLTAAIRDRAITLTGEVLDAHIETQRQRIVNNEARLGILEGSNERLAEILQDPGLSLAERTTIENQVVSNQIAILSLEDTIRSDEFVLTNWENTFQPAEEISVRELGSTGYHASNVVRGIAVGLFFGVLIALTWRSREDAR